MLRAIAGAVFAAALVFLPAAAQAQSNYEQCATGYRPPSAGPGYATVMFMYVAANNQVAVQSAAGMCSDDIAQPGSFPASKYGEWERRFGGRYRPICGITVTDAVTMNVYGPVGTEFDALFFCDQFYHDGWRVTDLQGVW